jgi:hypothetical protein
MVGNGTFAELLGVCAHVFRGFGVRGAMGIITVAGVVVGRGEERRLGNGVFKLGRSSRRRSAIRAVVNCEAESCASETRGAMAAAHDRHRKDEMTSDHRKFFSKWQSL